MYPRTEYKMTDKDLKELLNSCQPTPVIKIGNCSMGKSAQENANLAWEVLGKKMGFDSNTVQPVNGKGRIYFTAIPSETEFQQKERKKEEDKKAKDKRIKELKDEITEKTEELEGLL